MHRKTISYADNTWLRMNDPNNLMIITGLMTFDAPLDYERLKLVIEQRLLHYRRYRQRLVQPLLPFKLPYWEDDPSFDLENHLQRVILSPPSDQKALQELISLLMSMELDDSHPLWQFYLVENYASGSALILRQHHSIADGIALMQVLLSLTDPAPDLLPESSSQPGNHTLNEPAKTLKSTSMNGSSMGVVDVLKEGKKMLLHPSHAVERARQGIDIASAVGKIVLHWPDPPTVFKGPLGNKKCAVWSEPLELQNVKWIGKTLDGSVNDILITAVTGALGRYTEFRGLTAEDLNIRGFIPINLRPPSLDVKLGNKFGLLFLSLPLGIQDPVERLRKVKQNMDKLKSSPEALATYGIINLLGAVPAWIEGIAIDLFDSKGTTTMTNVPGPRGQLYMAGEPVNTIMGWVPQSGRISLGISIISYNGKVWLGIATDEGLIPDPETILSMFYLEYQEMITQAQQIQAKRRELLQPIFSMLDESIQTLDELLADSGEDKGA